MLTCLILNDPYRRKNLFTILNFNSFQMFTIVKIKMFTFVN